MKKAFTMMELLIVMGIIGLLAAMITVVSKRARDQGKEAITRQRIESVVQGLLAYQSDGSLAMSLQYGPLQASIDNGFARANDTWDAVELAPVNTRYLYFWDAPYGKKPQDFVKSLPGLPDSIDQLSNFNPQKTIELLYASGVMTDPRTEERTTPSDDPTFTGATLVPYRIASQLLAKDRSTRMAWNDAWGNPIIVSYAIYQTRGDATLRAKEVRDFGFNRTVYLSAGAVGASKPASINYSGSWITSTGVLQTSWKTINATVNSDNGDDTFVSGERYMKGLRPWGGIATGKGKGPYSNYTCYLSAPQEIK